MHCGGAATPHTCTKGVRLPSRPRLPRSVGRVAGWQVILTRWKVLKAFFSIPDSHKIPLILGFEFHHELGMERIQWIQPGSTGICSSILDIKGYDVRSVVVLANLKDIFIDWFQAVVIDTYSKLCIYGSLCLQCKWFQEEFYVDQCPTQLEIYLIPDTRPESI